MVVYDWTIASSGKDYVLWQAAYSPYLGRVAQESSRDHVDYRIIDIRTGKTIEEAKTPTIDIAKAQCEKYFDREMEKKFVSW